MNISVLIKTAGFIAGTTLFLASQVSFAVPIDCINAPENSYTTASMQLIDGETERLSDACVFDNGLDNHSGDAQLEWVNEQSAFGGGGFSFLGKFQTEEDDSESDEPLPEGYTLSVNGIQDNGTFDFQFSGPLNESFDVVFGVKHQPHLVGFYFEDVEFDMDGYFQTFNVQGNNLKVGNEFSHLSVFIRDRDVVVPEPGTAFLLATGIFGLVAGRKRMKKAA